MDRKPEIAGLPAAPGVYALRDARGRLLYVGKAVNLRRRVRSYFRPGGGHSLLTRQLKDVAVSVEHAPAGSELEALLAEARAIRAGIPAFNRTGVWPHRPGFVKLTAEPFPRVQVVRFPVADGARYYGPFRPAKELRGALAALQPVLRWRPCEAPSPGRCLYVQMGRCLAPCGQEGGPAPERAGERYGAMLRLLEAVLAGNGARVLDDLDRRMHDEAEALRFERAAVLRDRRAAIARLAARAEALAQDGVLVWVRAGVVRLLAIRSGRLARAADVGEPGGPPDGARIRAFVEEAWAVPAPGPARTPDDVREIDVVGRYLARARECFVPVRPDGVAEAWRQLAGMLEAARPASLHPSRLSSPQCVAKTDLPLGPNRITS